MTFVPPTIKEMAEFDEARRFYPGVKRGNDREFKNFCKKNKDWREALPLLLPAITKQIVWREKANGEFRPPWKNFQTWINQGCWEDELPAPRKPIEPMQGVYEETQKEQKKGNLEFIMHPETTWEMIEAQAEKWHWDLEYIRKYLEKKRPELFEGIK